MFSASLVPVLGIIGGAFLVFRGLGVLEALVAVGSAALIAGLVIAAGASLAKRRGQSTLVSAQQTFGRFGNAIPSGILLVIRIAALAILLVLTVSVATRVLELSRLWPFDLWIAQAVGAGVVSAVVMVLGIGGGRVLRIALWVSAGVGFVGLIAVVVRNASSLTFVTQSWSAEPLAVIGGASLVLSGFLVLWGATGGDLTDIRVGQGRSIVPLVTALGAVVPLAGVMMVSVWLAVSTPGSSVSLVADPVGVLVQGLPSWYPGPVLALLVIPLVGVASLILFSMGKSVEALGVPSSRVLHTSVVGAVSTVAAAAVIVLGLNVANDVPGVLVGFGLIFAAWAGAFAIDSLMSRGADVHAVPGWRIAPLAGMVVAIGVGFGLVSSSVSWLSWQGYLLPLLHNAGLIDLSPAAPGVLVALILSALVTLIASLGARVKASAQSHG
jgi:purine-cytosine permease-like protein